MLNPDYVHHAVDTGEFSILADHAAEQGHDKIESLLRSHRPALGPPKQWYENPLTNRTPSEHIARVLKAPKLAPGIYMVPGQEGSTRATGFHLYDFREKMPRKSDEKYQHLYEAGADDTAAEMHYNDLEDYLHKHKPIHFFPYEGDHGGAGSHLHLAAQGDFAHITGYTKGGDCEHCGKKDPVLIHVTTADGKTQKIGSTCAGKMLCTSLGETLHPKTAVKLAHQAQMAANEGYKESAKKMVRLKLARDVSGVHTNSWLSIKDHHTHWFKSGDNEYLAHFYKLPQNGHLQFEFRQVGHPDEYGITGAGNATKTMTTVAAHFLDGLRRFKPNVVHFSAEEPSRQKLYEWMGSKLERHAPEYQFKKGMAKGSYRIERKPVTLSRPEVIADATSQQQDVRRKLAAQEAKDAGLPTIARKTIRLKLAREVPTFTESPWLAARNGGYKLPFETEGTKYTSRFDTVPSKDGHYDFNFEQHGVPDEYGITGAGNATKTMTTVAAHLLDGLRRFRPAVVHIFAGEPSRRKLYEWMGTKLQRFAPEYQFKKSWALGSYRIERKLELSRPEVIADANSQQQEVRRKLAAQIAQEAGLKLSNLTDARSNNQAGLLQTFEHDNDHDGVEYAAAWYGLLSRSPSLTTFHTGNGPDTYHTWRTHLDPDKVVSLATQMNLQPVVTSDGQVSVLDRGNQNSTNVSALQKASYATNPTSETGTAKTFAGRPDYYATIKRYSAGPVTDANADTKVTE